MSARRWLVLVLGIVLLAVATGPLWLPPIVRHVVIARLHAATQRPVSIDAVAVNLFTGRFAVRGLRLTERDGSTPFAEIQRLELRLHLPSLLIGRLRLRELLVDDSTVRVVRLASDEFNLSDLVRSSGAKSEPLDLTVDRFALMRGTVILEDQALPERQRWTSEQITIEARNVSTRHADGSALGRSVTAGAPVSVEVQRLRLYPIHLEATVTVSGLDLTPAQVYVPARAPVRLERGRVSTNLALEVDARDGVRAHGTTRLQDVALVKREGADPLALVPDMTIDLAGFDVRDAGMALQRLTVEGSMNVRDPRARPGARLVSSSVRARVTDLTWPATTPGHVDIQTSIPGGGSVAVTGTVQPPPAPTQLRLRLADLDLASWAEFLPTAARVRGQAEANLSMNEPFGAGIPARVAGSIAVNRPGVADARHEVLAARRIEASGLELHWPTRVIVKRVLVSDPRGVLERDRAGNFPVKELARGPASSASTSSTRASSTPASRGDRPAAAGPSLAVEVGEVSIRNGAVGWRDASLSPPARLDVAAINLGVTGVGWPLQGPLGLRGSLRPPGGGAMQLTGRVTLDPLAADMRIVAQKAELAPYQPYLPTRARIEGATDLDLAVVVPTLTERRAMARGRAGLSGVNVRDGERTVMRIDRATASGVDVDWPARVAIDRLALAGWWFLFERDDRGRLPLRDLIPPPSTAETASPAASPPSEPSTAREQAAPERSGDSTTATTITVSHLAFDDGGIRVVDRSVSPAFAVDVQRARLRMEGLSTEPGKAARMELAANVGPATALTMRGTVAAFGDPLLLDVNGDLRDFALERTNPYLLRQVGWKTREGRLSTKLHCRLQADALSARTDIRLSRLQLVRASSQDEAQKRIGLPLGMITALMKDRRGDITLSFPVSGTLSDPRFDFREAIWTALRRVAVNAITLPVSMIGRVHVGSDARIDRIDVNPAGFEPGTATLTSEGQHQVARLAEFLEQLPEVKMGMAPVVSSRDVAELKRRTLEAALERVAAPKQLARDAAAMRLFEQRFPDRPAPATPEAALAALLAHEPTPPSAVPELGARRLQVVRGTIEKAGIDAGRLVDLNLIERSDAGAAVEFDVRPPQTQQPSKFREVLRRLGVPLKGGDAKE